MLNVDTKRRIDTARDILVGKVPDPKSQVEQITIALIYKFMDDMDKESEELGGKAKFFTGEYRKYAWSKIFDPKISGFEIVNVYGEAIQRMNQNPNIPQLFRDIFKNAYLPYRDPETLKSFLKSINDFQYDHSERLGDAFEYLLSVLGSQGEAGQFRTPRHIIDFMVEIVDPKKNESILDPACGTAGFLISSYKYILKHNSENFDSAKDPKAFELHGVKLEEITINSKKYRGDKLNSDEKERLANNIVGYDISPDMVRLSLVNMYLHGFSNPKIFEYDTLTSEARWNEYADIIMANPPFMSPKGGIRPHKRFSIESKRSEVLFVDYIAEHLTPQGKSCVIVPEGIIFQSQTAYKNLRKMLIEKNYLVGVISLPAGVFNPYSGVKTSILWMDRILAKKTDEILFVKIENDGFDLGAQRRPIKENDLPEAFRAIVAYKESLVNGKKINVDKWKNISVVKKVKIGKGDYNLTGERYKLIPIGINQKYRIINLGELISTLTPPKKIQKSNFASKGKYPIIDQSQDIISGWTDDETAVINSSKPVVIFGDHTCTVKFQEGPFVQGADGIKIIETKDILLPKYLFYCLKYKPLPSSGYQRHFSKLKEYKIPLPPIAVQEGIVAELESYQKIIDNASQIIGSYRPKIKIDPTWKLDELGNLFVETRLGLVKDKSKQSSNYPYPYIKMDNITIDGHLDLSNVVYVEATQEEINKYTLREGDFIYNTRNAPNLVGKSTVFHGEKEKYLFNNNILRVRFQEGVNSDFVNYYLNSLEGKAKIKKLVSGTTSVAALYQKNFATITIPLPSIQEQNKIVDEIKEEMQFVISVEEMRRRFEEKTNKVIRQIWEK